MPRGNKKIMTIKQQLTENMKSAMKAQQKDKLMTIRSLLSEIKNAEIDGGEDSDAAAQKIVARMIKQWKDALNDYEKASREDLVLETKGKIKVLEEYMPEQMTDEDVREIAKGIIDNSPVKDFGPLMGQVMKKVAGKADGARVSVVIKELLHPTS
jgi:uncharacterized protein